MSSILYQDRDVRDKWLKNYLTEMNSKKEIIQMDVLTYYINKPSNKQIRDPKKSTKKRWKWND